MATKKGDGLLMVYCNVAAEHEEEFNRWYNEEHMPERLAIPGVLSAARYKAVDGGPIYLACYELESPDAWYAEAWQRGEPSRRSAHVASVIGIICSEPCRRICHGHPADRQPRYSGAPRRRISVPAHLDAKFNDAYNHERYPVPAHSGLHPLDG
jgi:hypothetical protein